MLSVASHRKFYQSFSTNWGLFCHAVRFVYIMAAIEVMTSYFWRDDPVVTRVCKFTVMELTMLLLFWADSQERKALALRNVNRGQDELPA